MSTISDDEHSMIVAAQLTTAMAGHLKMDSVQDDIKRQFRDFFFFVEKFKESRKAGRENRNEDIQ